MDNYQTILQANIEYHNQHAKDYDAFTMMGNFKRVEEVFKKYQGGKMLDMGCGTGLQLEVAKKYFDVYGVDCSPEMLKLAKKITPNVFLADASDTSFQSNEFNFINCFSVFHHCYSQLPIIKEAYRVLKEGGVFYSDNDPNRGFYRIFKWWLLFRRKFLREKDKHLGKELRELEKKAEYHQGNGLDPKMIKYEFENVGFKKVEVIYHHPEHPDTFTKIIMFLNKFLKSNNLYYYFSIIATK